MGIEEQCPGDRKLTLSFLDRLDETLKFTVLFAEPAGGIQGNFLDINSGADSLDAFFYLSMDQIVPGTYIPNVIEVSATDPGTGNYIFGFCQGCQDMEVTLTSVGAIGEPLIGTFSGTTDSNPGFPAKTLTGSFKVIRDY